MSRGRFAEVVVALPIDGAFWYAAPEPLGPLEVGQRVIVPFRGRTVTGFVVGLAEALPDELSGRAIAEVQRVVEPYPLVSPDLMEVIRFAGEYYLAPIGEVLKVALPPGLTARSKTTYRATAAGRELLASVRGERFELGATPSPAKLERKDMELLALAARPGGLSGARALGAGRLVRAGLLRLESVLRSKEAPEVARYRATGVPAGRAGPIARALLDALLAGPRDAGELVRALPTFDPSRLRAALLRLVKAGQVAIDKVPLTAPERPGADFTLELTSAQAAALAAIQAALARREHRAFLLRGVTGSGKTEIYLRAIADVLAGGGGAIVLVPEIALTAQLEARFRAHFGNAVATVHSALPEKERRLAWYRLRRGEAKIALGPRSAVWAPIDRPRLFVVDEEHDPSLKQHAELRYHGRDLAMYRASRSQAVVVLGTATPSLESHQLAVSGRIAELRLDRRIGPHALPTVEVVRMTALDKDARGERPVLSPTLLEAIRAAVERGEQAIVFLNRRGFNTLVVCDECGEPRSCPSCDVSLTHHRGPRTLVCHHCGHEEPFAGRCKKCGSEAMRPFGAGTERIEALLSAAVPSARIARLDRDVTESPGALTETLDAFRERRLDVLVGTQMVTKGLDFPHVTVVGVVIADAALGIPDFRAAERTFQLLTQVAGRAGRAALPGRAIVQAFDPEHYAIAAAIAQDADGFLAAELAARARHGYPPVRRAGLVRVEAVDPEVGRALAATIRERLDALGPDLEVKGPAAAPIERLRGRHRRQVLVLAKSPARLVQALRAVRDAVGPPPPRVVVTFDVDVYDLL